MKKIRINELARELEVKAHEILDRLPELGVTEKKTHSSSIDEDVAIKLRRLYGFDVPDLPPETEEERAASDAAAEAEERAELVAAAPPAVPEHVKPEPAVTAEPAAVAEPPVVSKPVAEEPRPAVAAPIRPPLAGRPIHPPVGAHTAAPRPEAPRPEAPRAAPAPPAPVPAPPPQTPPVAVIAPGRPAPPAAKPLPGPSAPGSPRPGQILSGPRQPFPPKRFAEGGRVSGPGSAHAWSGTASAADSSGVRKSTACAAGPGAPASQPRTLRPVVRPTTSARINRWPDSPWRAR